MGWNQVVQARRTRSGRAFPTRSYFYFVHSYYARPSDARHSVGRHRLRRPLYLRRWRAIIFLRPSSIPKKAPTHGLALYRNFLHWNP